eukprot:g31933.t1
MAVSALPSLLGTPQSTPPQFARALGTPRDLSESGGFVFFPQSTTQTDDTNLSSLSSFSLPCMLGMTATASNISHTVLHRGVQSLQSQLLNVVDAAEEGQRHEADRAVFHLPPSGPAGSSNPSSGSPAGPTYHKLSHSAPPKTRRRLSSSAPETKHNGSLPLILTPEPEPRALCNLLDNLSPGSSQGSLVNERLAVRAELGSPLPKSPEPRQETREETRQRSASSSQEPDQDAMVDRLRRLRGLAVDQPETE